MSLLRSGKTPSQIVAEEEKRHEKFDYAPVAAEPKTVESIYRDMVEQDLSTPESNLLTEVQTAYLSGLLSDAQYKEFYDLLANPSKGK